MTVRFLGAFALAGVAVFANPSLGIAASRPALHAVPRALPTPRLPNQRLHTEFTVEVNHLGQIVRVKTGKESTYPPFNAMTYGNVLQMFIRRPDGSAVVGMYRVTYDYDPHTKNVHRNVNILSQGGDWANEEGAVSQMLRVNERNAQRHRQLPGLDQIIKPTSKPTKA